jgi:hypothetical protein
MNRGPNVTHLGFHFGPPTLIEIEWGIIVIGTECATDFDQRFQMNLLKPILTTFSGGWDNRYYGIDPDCINW